MRRFLFYGGLQVTFNQVRPANIQIMAEFDYTIRHMIVEDHQALLALWRHSKGIGVRSADSYDGLARYLDRNPRTSYVACKDQDIIGTILAGTDGRRGLIHHLAVDEQYRGNGIGQALLNAALEALSQMGIEKCSTFVFRTNEKAIVFWNKVGWTERDELTTFSKILSDDDNA